MGVMTKEMILAMMLKEDHSEVMMMVITRKEMEATKTLKTAMAQMIIVRVIIAKVIAAREMIPTNEEKMIPLPKARTILKHLMVKMRVMILRKMIKMDLDRKMRAITMTVLSQLKKTNPSMKMRILIQEIWMI